MHVLSAVMVGSNHAETYCHLKHHKHNMGAGDIEGHCGHMSFLAGPVFTAPGFPLI